MFTSFALQATMMVILVPIPKERPNDDRRPGYLGVRFQKVEDGIYVTDVYDESPAKNAGMQVNDIIVKIEDRSTRTMEQTEMVRVIGGTRPGTVVPMEVRRGGQLLTLKVKILPRPDSFQPVQEPVIPGQELVPED